jgi:SAM-dependent methyltransferase
MSPLANAYVTDENRGGAETLYPLHAYVCHNCFLVQLPVFEGPREIFEEYAYFSSYSSSWLEHSKKYAEMITGRQGLSLDSFVVEIASNDGYLLQYFNEMGINVLGVEPAKNVAGAANQRGVNTVSEFFTASFAEKLTARHQKADLVIANNVLAHVPDINDFVSGICLILKDGGIATLEFPSLLNLIKQNQFDTIYHEHFSYLSLGTAERIFKSQGLKIFDVEELPTHGGSLRVYACKALNGEVAAKASVSGYLNKEGKYGLYCLETYEKFSERIKNTKREILKALISLKDQGKTIAGYGAPAKGNTLLNYCGVRGDFLDYTADISPHKQNKYLPGTGIPIFHPDKISETKPDYILILPWNLKDEIIGQLKYVREWGCKFIIPIPKVEVIC